MFSQGHDPMRHTQNDFSKNNSWKQGGHVQAEGGLQPGVDDSDEEEGVGEDDEDEDDEEGIDQEDEDDGSDHNF